MNTAINLTKVNTLAWQERKAGSFVFTRLYCGYSLRAGGSGADVRNSYQSASDYLSSLNRKGWISLGQASGALVAFSMRSGPFMSGP